MIFKSDSAVGGTASKFIALQKGSKEDAKEAQGGQVDDVNSSTNALRGKAVVAKTK